MTGSIIPGVRATGGALDAERTRLEVAALNLANLQTTRGPDGQPWRRREVVFETVLGPAPGRAGGPNVPIGVRAARIVESGGPLPRIHQPGHPDADADGFVTLPNVSLPEEMANLMTAGRSYEANVQVLSSARQMLSQVLRLGR